MTASKQRAAIPRARVNSTRENAGRESAFSPLVNLYIAAEARDPNRDDIARILARARTRRRCDVAMRLKKTYLNYGSHIVCAINSAFTSWAKPQCSAKLILRSGRRIADRV